jgi:hypothetical protein
MTTKTTTSQFTFISDGAEFPTYTVFAGGVEIGRVWRAWFRLGGNSWTHNLVAASGFASRLEAARNLHRLWQRRQELDAANAQAEAAAAAATKAVADHIEGVLQLLDQDALVAVFEGRVDMNRIVREQLANRGFDPKGNWIGFPAARKLYVGE